MGSQLPSATPSIFISSLDLHRFFCDAADNERDVGKEGDEDTIDPAAKKRLRSMTPAEELFSDDERTFAEMEGRDAKRVARGDLSYSR